MSNYQLDDLRLSDSDFPEPRDEIQAPAPYKPGPEDQTALEAFIDSGGSVHEASRASGLPTSNILALTRKVWWREVLTRRNFVPITAEELGNHIAIQAGRQALDRLSGDTYLDTNDLVKLGQLGVGMMKNKTDVNVTNVQIGSLNQVDLRGMSPEQLSILAGGDDEIIDV